MCVFDAYETMLIPGLWPYYTRFLFDYLLVPHLYWRRWYMSVRRLNRMGIGDRARNDKVGDARKRIV